MIKDVNLSDEYLKAVTGKFDLETVFNLELVNKGISNLGSIPKCTSLLYLDLNHNNISSINGIQSLVHVMFLDLSFNKISDISYLLPLRDLINCKLQGNNISGPFPAFFAKMTKLEKLTFYEYHIVGKPNVNTSNPLCENANYRQEILDAVPQLMWLDGVPRDMEEFSNEFKEDDKDIKEKLNPDNFNFIFDGKINLNQEDVLPKENIENAKKNIEDHYSEFQKCLEKVKKELEEIK